MPHSIQRALRSTISEEPHLSNISLGERYWNRNLPQGRWTEECPNFLLGQGTKTVGILSSKQEDYHWLTWSESKQLVESNHIDRFQRPPLELRRYLHFMFKLKQQYGSVLTFVQQERLHWESTSPSEAALFTNPSDYRILFNDWPYGIDPDITHLVVWTKFLLDDDPITGFLTPEHHELIEKFVQETFCDKDGINRKDVIWFKNWKSLKSVHALEHFHVMLYQAPAEFLQRVTQSDKPLSEMVEDL